MKVLITGATGVMGLPLIEELRTRSCEVVVLASPGSCRNQLLHSVAGASVRWMECGLADYDSFSLPERFDVFVHMAWLGGLDRWNVDLNIASAQQCAAAVRLATRLGCHTFVATGSQAECGPQLSPLSADTLCVPDTPFGAAKNLARDLARIEARKTHGLKFVWVRILSVYGPYDREGSMIISSIRKLMMGEVPAYTQANQLWDFLYATDAARAMADILFSGRDGQIYVLGSGDARPLREYIALIVGRFGVSLEQCLGKVTMGSSTPSHLAANVEPLRHQFGWVPQVSFEEGLEKIIQYCMSFSQK
jgi:UDP-glucose 4-epimerase